MSYEEPSPGEAELPPPMPEDTGVTTRAGAEQALVGPVGGRSVQLASELAEGTLAASRAGLRSSLLGRMAGWALTPALGLAALFVGLKGDMREPDPEPAATPDPKPDTKPDPTHDPAHDPVSPDAAAGPQVVGFPRDPNEKSPPQRWRLPLPGESRDGVIALPFAPVGDAPLAMASGAGSRPRNGGGDGSGSGSGDGSVTAPGEPEPPGQPATPKPDGDLPTASQWPLLMSRREARSTEPMTGATPSSDWPEPDEHLLDKIAALRDWAGLQLDAIQLADEIETSILADQFLEAVDQGMPVEVANRTLFKNQAAEQLALRRIDEEARFLSKAGAPAQLVEACRERRDRLQALLAAADARDPAPPVVGALPVAPAGGPSMSPSQALLASLVRQRAVMVDEGAGATELAQMDGQIREARRAWLQTELGFVESREGGVPRVLSLQEMHQALERWRAGQEGRPLLDPAQWLSAVPGRDAASPAERLVRVDDALRRAEAALANSLATEAQLFATDASDSRVERQIERTRQIEQAIGLLKGEQDRLLHPESLSPPEHDPQVWQPWNPQAGALPLSELDRVLRQWDGPTEPDAWSRGLHTEVPPGVSPERLEMARLLAELSMLLDAIDDTE